MAVKSSSPKSEKKSSVHSRRAKVKGVLKNSGQFSSFEIESIDRSLGRADTRDEVLAQSIVSILDFSGISKNEVSYIKSTLSSALAKIARGEKEPFSDSDISRIKEIFSNRRVPEKTKQRFTFEVSVNSNDQLISFMNTLLSVREMRQQGPFTTLNSSGRLTAIPKKRK